MLLPNKNLCTYSVAWVLRLPNANSPYYTSTLGYFGVDKINSASGGVVADTIKYADQFRGYFNNQTNNKPKKSSKQL